MKLSCDEELRFLQKTGRVATFAKRIKRKIYDILEDDADNIIRLGDSNVVCEIVAEGLHDAVGVYVISSSYMDRRQPVVVLQLSGLTIDGIKIKADFELEGCILRNFRCGGTLEINDREVFNKTRLDM